MFKRMLAELHKTQIFNLRYNLQRRWESVAGSDGAKTVMAEEHLATSLKEHFPNATFIQVNDVSGGCGAMFEVTVEAPDFKGLSIVKQHRLVTSALNQQIKDMHGIRIQTIVPS